MKTRKILGILILGAILVALFLGFRQGQTGSPAGGTSVKLLAPAFVTAAQAAGNTADSFISNKLDEEAGISAYYKSSNPITLNQSLRNQFRTIEVETANYIIGSVPVPNHVEHFDVHVYVDTTGWILAYYLRSDPVSKIVDVKARTINTTKLTTVVSTIASAAGVAFTNVAYYDFRYPAATNMLFVAENYSGGDDFTIQIPSFYGYHERSWSLFYDPYTTSYFTVDGQSGPNRIFAADNIQYGTLTGSQLLPDTEHTIRVKEYGVLVIVYSVPR